MGACLSHELMSPVAPWPNMELSLKTLINHQLVLTAGDVTFVAHTRAARGRFWGFVGLKDSLGFGPEEDSPSPSAAMAFRTT